MQVNVSVRLSVCDDAGEAIEGRVCSFMSRLYGIDHHRVTGVGNGNWGDRLIIGRISILEIISAYPPFIFSAHTNFHLLRVFTMIIFACILFVSNAISSNYRSSADIQKCSRLTAQILPAVGKFSWNYYLITLSDHSVASFSEKSLSHSGFLINIL